MSQNRVEGAGHKAAGAVKEAAGKITGDEKMAAEGRAEKDAGKIQNAVGKVQDKIGDAIKH